MYAVIKIYDPTSLFTNSCRILSLHDTKRGAEQEYRNRIKQERKKRSTRHTYSFNRVPDVIIIAN